MLKTAPVHSVFKTNEILVEFRSHVCGKNPTKEMPGIVKWCDIMKKKDRWEESSSKKAQQQTLSEYLSWILILKINKAIMDFGDNIEKNNNEIQLNGLQLYL